MGNRKDALKMPTLNGKTYEMQYLTDEETAVINSMRRGARISVFFHGLETLAEADELMALFAGVGSDNKWIFDLDESDSISFSHRHDIAHVNYIVKK